ncbi:MAG TPA: GNAT family N-acetyltransferase [Acidobacteriaceae bacterium]|jgi:GNAT superfamily N-acetyltransferase
MLRGAVAGGNYFHRERDGFVISTDPSVLDARAVFAFLEQARWWNDLTHESLDRALNNSLCFSLFEEGRQIGLARVISDRVTFAYLCDVFITEDRRGKGLGAWLVRCVLDHPDVKDLKRVALITHDVQAFYLKLDFRFAPCPEYYMERLR